MSNVNSHVCAVAVWAHARWAVKAKGYGLSLRGGCHAVKMVNARMIAAGVLHTWQTVHPHTFVHFSHRTARADGVLSQSFHGHSHTLTLHGRTQHMVTSAPV